MAPSPDAEKTKTESMLSGAGPDPKDPLRAKPFQVLGITSDSAPETVRARYLELVKLHPPDQDPAVFAKIRHAYEAASDPVLLAQRMIELSSAESRPWLDIIEQHRERPPRLTTELLLSLGNRKRVTSSRTEADS